MISLLRCPNISIDLINKYLKYSDDARSYSNFGFCEKLLREKLSNILNVSYDNLLLGSSATSLLWISCHLFANQIKQNEGIFYFPAFSFFSTFSIASSLDNKISFYDIKDFSFLPFIERKITKNDFVFLNVPFGSSFKLREYLDFAGKLPCPVVIDAAACLPGVIRGDLKFDNFPPNTIIVFSLHATKLISAGEGGLCLFGKKMPSYIKNLTNFGIVKGRKQKWLNSTNAKMSEFNAAACLSSLDMFKKNADEIIKAKKKAFEICLNYKLKTFADKIEPTLTLNIINEKSDILLKLTDNNYEYRRWWSLTNFIDKEKHVNSIKAYDSILGIPFDWENIDSYFEKMCKQIS